MAAEAGAAAAATGWGATRAATAAAWLPRRSRWTDCMLAGNGLVRFGKKR